MTRVLIVEDSADILFILKTELEWQGFTVDVALDGKAGLEAARAHGPDVIVSDIRMPGIDGLEFIKRIRQIPELQTVPAIALTGGGMQAQINQAIASGFTMHLTKPVEAAELINTLHKLTEKKLTRKAG